MGNLRDYIKILESGSRDKGGAIDSGIPSLGAEHLGNNGKLILGKKMKYISYDHYEQMRTGKIQKGDVLVVKDGATTGKTSFVNSDFPYSKAAINEHVFLLRPNNMLLPKFLFHYLYSECGQRLILQDFRGATVGGISRDFIDIPIKLPPLDVQQKIADVLDKASALIELRSAQLDKLDLLIKSQFIEIFGNPVTNPMRWPIVDLHDCLISIDNGKSFVCESESRTGNYPAVLKLSAVTYGHYQPGENKAVTSAELFVKAAEVHDGDLLFTRKNTPELVGMCAYIFKTPSNLMMPDLIFRLNTNDRCNKIYLWQLINHDLFRNCIQNLASGSAKSMSNISKERLSNLCIILPPRDLQKEFADFVSQVENQKQLLNQSLSQLELNYKSLMQKCFRGELF